MDAALTIALISLVGAIGSALIAASSHRATERLRRGREVESRLEVATGSLQLEQFLETRSFARRLGHYFKENRPLAARRAGSDPDAYHAGGMMIYRILRPLTVGEIIQKQTLAGDLLLDPVMMDLVRFNQAAVEMLSGEEVGRPDGGKAPKEFDMSSCWNVGDEWSTNFQRVRGSYLRCGAAALLAAEPADRIEPRRCITHAEFCKLWEGAEHDSQRGREFHQALEPIKATMHLFDRRENPILWLRLVGYAYACNRYFEQMWQSMGSRRFRQRFKDLWHGREPVRFEPIEVAVRKMLTDVREGGGGERELNRHVADHADDYVERFDVIIGRSL